IRLQLQLPPRFAGVLSVAGGPAIPVRRTPKFCGRSANVLTEHSVPAQLAPPPARSPDGNEQFSDLEAIWVRRLRHFRNVNMNGRGMAPNPGVERHPGVERPARQESVLRARTFPSRCAS